MQLHSHLTWTPLLTSLILLLVFRRERVPPLFVLNSLPRECSLEESKRSQMSRTKTHEQLNESIL